MTIDIEISNDVPKGTKRLFKVGVLQGVGDASRKN